MRRIIGKYLAEHWLANWLLIIFLAGCVFAGFVWYYESTVAKRAAAQKTLNLQKKD